MVVKTLLHNSTLCSAELPGTWLSICMLSVISLIQIWGEISDFDRPHLGDYSRHSYQLGCEFESRSATFYQVFFKHAVRLWTRGASKNLDWPHQNGPYFPPLFVCFCFFSFLMNFSTNFFDNFFSTNFVTHFCDKFLTIPSYWIEVSTYDLVSLENSICSSCCVNWQKKKHFHCNMWLS